MPDQSGKGFDTAPGKNPLKVDSGYAFVKQLCYSDPMKHRILFFVGAICLSVASAFGLSYGHCQISASDSASCGSRSMTLAQLGPAAISVEELRAPVMPASEDRIAHASVPLATVPETAVTAPSAAPLAPAVSPAPVSVAVSKGSMPGFDLTLPEPRGMTVLYSDAPLGAASQPRLSTMSPDIAAYSGSTYLGVTEVQSMPDYLIGVYR